MADGKIVIDTEIDQSGIDQGINQAQSKLEGLGGKLMGAGTKLTKGLTLPIVGAGIATAKFAIDQETAFAKVQTLLSGSSADYEKYKNDIRTASSDMGVSFGEYSEAVYQSISAGVDQGKAIEFTTTAAKLAKGGFTQTATAVDLLTTAINAYGLESKDADRLSDMLINTQNMGKTTVDELSASMGKVIPIANANNVSFEQLATGYAVLTKNGLATAEAGTYMSSMLGELGSAGSKTDKILREKTGKSFAQLQEEGMTVADVLQIIAGEAEANDLALSDMFGSKEAGIAAMSLLSGEGKDFADILDSMGESAGATDAAFETMNETTGAKMARAFVRLQNAAAQFGDIFLPIIAAVADKVAEFALRVAELLPEFQNIVVIAGLVLGALGPLLILFGLMITAVGKIIGVFGSLIPIFAKIGKGFALIKTFILALLSPIGLIVAAIVGFIAVFVYLYKTNEEFRDKVNAIWEAIVSVIKTAVQGIVDFAMQVWGMLVEFWITHQDQIMEATRNVWEFIKTFVAGAVDVIAAVFSAIWPVIQFIVISVWNNIKGAIEGALTFIQGLIQVFTGLFTGDFSLMWEGIKNVFTGAIQFLWNAFNLLLYGRLIKAGMALFTGLRSIVSAGWSSIQGLFTGALNAIRGVVTNVMNAIRGVIQNIMNGVRTIFTNILNVIRNLVTSVFNGIRTTITTVMNAIRTVISTIWNGIMSFLNGIFTSMRTSVTNTFSAVRTTITTIMNAIRSLMQTVWTAIQTVITTVLNAIRTVVTTVFNTIRTTITTVLNTIRTTVQTIFNAISSTFSSVLNTVSNTVRTNFNTMQNIVTTILNAIRTVVNTVLNTISSLFTSVTGAIRNTVSSVFNALSGIVSSAMNGVRNAVSSGLTGALNVVKNMGESFRAAGRGLIEMMAAGIKAAVGVVTSAIGDVVGKVRDFLPFSPAKVGPLSDLDKLDFAGPIMDSIKKGEVSVEAAMSNLLTTDMMRSLNGTQGMGGNNDYSRSITNQTTINNNSMSERELQRILNRRDRELSLRLGGL
ncbi:phage tail tape measure protein [Paenalkalicoccus suaedae]|uniref:Phage tail tape measure protein n=1 Tax=Paenalkalicoccus suaedae TaxID=2592382 RepID=A0A859FEZ2_9BACI|nr:phage tail tape measure protein [Paenalkalicoccus suaedae]QKS71657.1 phage tail tape measure protein [Paenalkalicoccus suaedae]QKS71711.1 phage tail tape measure protein [Paenalkalicoccus suaedae]